MNTTEQLPPEVEKRFNEQFTYGGITGVVALNPNKFEHGLDDPRPFKRFLAQELAAQKEALLHQFEGVIGENEPEIKILGEGDENENRHITSQNDFRTYLRAKLTEMREG